MELADEVPAQAKVFELRRLFRGLLVPVLPDVGDAECGEPPDILGGVELGDHDQPRRPLRTSGRGNGVVDPLPDGGEPLPELFQPGIGLPARLNVSRPHRGLLLIHGWPA